MQLRWLQPAVDLLPRSVEQLEPPAGLRKRLMATVRAEARDVSRAGIEIAEPRRWRDWGTLLWRPATAVAAAALLIVGAAGGYLLHQPGESSSVITARPLPAAPSNLAGTLEREDGSAILTMSRLPALPSERRLRGLGEARRDSSSPRACSSPAATGPPRPRSRGRSTTPTRCW